MMVRDRFIKDFLGVSEGLRASGDGSFFGGRTMGDVRASAVMAWELGARRVDKALVALMVDSQAGWFPDERSLVREYRKDVLSGVDSAGFREDVVAEIVRHAVDDVRQALSGMGMRVVSSRSGVYAFIVSEVAVRPWSSAR
ncbi:hypothetical protein ABT282_07080 [Streptomyces sp. NPDC000927]|uniref:hypothetical protein n=1 Tax=Streptomyces sp. NPDC000927 TaxID=3154371 RepID=UPI003324A532